MIAGFVAAALAAPLSLSDALSEGLTSLGAVVVEAERDEALGEAATLRSAENPTVEYEHPGHGELRVSVPLPIAGQPIASARAAAAEKRAALARYDDGRAEIAARIALAYLEAVRDLERARTARVAAELAMRTRDAVDVLVAAGELSSVDGTLIVADAATAMSAALAAERDAEVSSRELELVLGRAPTGTVELAGWPGLTAPADVSPQDLPAVRAAEADAAAAARARTLATMDLLPTPELIGGWTWEGEGDPLYGVAVEVPVFAPGVGRVRSARASAIRAQAEGDLARLEATAGLEAARLDEAMSARAWEMADVRGLDEAMTQISAALEAGEYSWLDYVTRRERLLEALTNRIDARFRLEAARLALWRAAGLVPEVPP